ncbi:MAG TPA: LysE family transporter [Patescibacteria group bacterium]|nr:LysE family transporter [Patescibacteria group bacterium]
MSFLPEFFTVIVIHLLAVMSPGPDFVLISRNSLIYSRKVGIYSAIGLALGILVHVTYSLIGIGFIISQSIVLFSVLKLIGATYLLYIGYKCLRAQPHQEQTTLQEEKKDMHSLAAIRMGFLTNVLNPKATLFFFALFTQVINPHTPKFVQILYGMETSIMTFLWFGLVALLLSHPMIKKHFAALQHRLERVFGVILIALGIKVALSSSQ